ncbi:MAG TPA: DUF2752 domain-containing protein [Candidatus Angelobacter sp.]|nr:DUF2752 domain-containing protein [Candidatus Angelobacter sp.]
MKLSLRQWSHVIAGATVAGGAVLYRFSPTENGFYLRCPFHALTGLQCPGCGGTRAVYQILHLHLGQAFHLNAMVTVLGPFALAWFAYCYWSVLRRNYLPEIRLSQRAVAGLCMLALIYTVVRNTVLSV